MERFAGNCNTICSSTSLSDDLKATCDLGSLDYCVKTGDAALIGAECKTFIPRVVGSYVAEQKNTVYSNPIKIPAGATRKVPDYFNSIASVAKTYATKDPITLGSTFTNDFVSTLKANGMTSSSDYYKDLVASGLANCSSATPNAALCTSTSSWFYNYIKDEYVKGLTVTHAANPLNAYTVDTKIKNLHKLYSDLFKPFEDLIISKLVKSDLSKPLLVELRSYSTNMRVGIDNFVINLIKVSKESFQKERLDQSIGTTIYEAPTITNGLVNKPIAYDTDIQTFLNEINKFRTANSIATPDPLVTLFKQTTDSNLTYCGSANPLTTPVCTTMKTTLTADPAVQTSINNSFKSYCTTNVQDPKCVSYINTTPSDFNLNDVNQKMLTYCMSAAGKADVTNCKSFSSINGSADWLKDKTKNIVTKNADGTTSISTVCGTANGLAKDMCINVCNQYPDLCKADVQDKCALPQYRYSTDTDVFTNKEGMSGNDEAILGYSLSSVVLMFLAILLFVWLFKSKRRNLNWLTNLFKSNDSNHESFHEEEIIEHNH